MGVLRPSGAKIGFNLDLKRIVLMFKKFKGRHPNPREALPKPYEKLWAWKPKLTQD